jgi:hypothetical protein
MGGDGRGLRGEKSTPGFADRGRLPSRAHLNVREEAFETV